MAPWKDDRSTQRHFPTKDETNTEKMFISGGTLMMKTPPRGGKIQYWTKTGLTPPSVWLGICGLKYTSGSAQRPKIFSHRNHKQGTKKYKMSRCGYENTRTYIFDILYTCHKSVHIFNFRHCDALFTD
jgi:hypothetical protein